MTSNPYGDHESREGLLIANSGEVGYCLTASAQQSLDAETETLIAVAHALRGEGHDASEGGTGRGTPIVPVAYGLSTQQEPKWAEDVSPTLALPSKTGGGQVTAVAIQERAVSENPDAGPDGVGCSTEGAAYTLEARHHVQAVAFAENQRGEVALSDVASQLNTGGGKPGQGYAAVAFSFKDYGNDATEEASPTLRSLGHYDANGGSQMAVAFDMRGREGGAMPEGPHDTANIRAADGGSSRSYVAQPWAVRRLTPRECERLQGFPDGFTAIPWRGKPADLCPDGPRYKALGNSWAVNVADWIGSRIAEVESWGGAA